MAAKKAPATKAPAKKAPAKKVPAKKATAAKSSPGVKRADFGKPIEPYIEALKGPVRDVPTRSSRS